MSNNVLALARESIDVNALELNMRVYVDIGSYWPKNLSVNAAYEELLMQGRKVDRRTLVAAKTGILTKSEYLTLIRLRDWVREISGNPSLTVDDLLKIENECKRDEQ
jgi:hypothetical protein